MEEIMKKILLILPFLFACAGEKTDTAAEDTAAAEESAEEAE